MNAFWGSYEKTVTDWLDKTEKQDIVRRIWAKDVSLWTKDANGQKEAAARLGWLAAPKLMKEKAADVKAFAGEIRAAGFTKVLLLGMGGSSLAPEVFQSVFGSGPGCPELCVLDSTDPLRVKDVEASLDLSKTLVIVSSKSGGTIELISFFKYFFAKIKAVKGAEAGSHFMAITDPGTPLAELAKKNGFRRTFLAPEDVGGRFSALTYFGLVPAALIGVDIDRVLDSALKMAEEASLDYDIEGNPAVPLGLGMAVLAGEGRDKLTIVSGPALASFADWAEQLVAESTGKEDLGIVPVAHETLERPGLYGNDRFFVSLSLGPEKPELAKKLQALQSAGHPVLNLELQDKHDLGGEFFRWEFATALACALLKVNAFDQPDVQSAKDAAKALLKKIEAGETLKAPKSETDFAEFWDSLEEGDYIGVLAFLPYRDDVTKALKSLQSELRGQTKKAVTLGFGPRYLHSTGQLHKGGANNGAFIFIAAKHSEDAEIAGEKYGFKGLEWAQAIGDLEALKARGRRVLYLELAEPSGAAIEALSSTLLSSIKARD